MGGGWGGGVGGGGVGVNIATDILCESYGCQCKLHVSL